MAAWHCGFGSGLENFGSGVDGSAMAPPVSEGERPRVLVFSKIGEWRDMDRRLPGFYHRSMPAGREMLSHLGAEHGFELTFTDTSELFTEAGLAPFEAIVFLNPNGFVFNTEERAAFKNFILSGKGYVGIHAAANCELDWPWYKALIGMYETGVHARKAVGKVTVTATNHPSTENLPHTFEVEDEWLRYSRDVRELEGEGFKILAVVDEATYRPGADTVHTIAWYREFEGARIWYTGFGHHAEVFAHPHVIEHIGGGIRYALDLAPAEAQH